MSFARQIVPGRIYLVTRRCTQRQFLLRPDDETNNAFRYCLAYAANRNGIAVIAYIANSNHYHAVVIDKEGRIPRFLEEFHRLVAKHQNALRGRWENFWASEQTSLVELVGNDDVLAKTVYTLTNPVKDHLVESAVEWPGSSSLDGNLKGISLPASRPARFFRADGSMPEKVELKFARVPGLEQLDDREYAERLKEAISHVEIAADRERRDTGRRVLGVRAVLAQQPSDRPESREPRRNFDPHVASKDKWPRIEAIVRLKEFRAAYAVARDAWLHGHPCKFPEGTWWLSEFATIRLAESSKQAA
jgi:putative transposase